MRASIQLAICALVSLAAPPAALAVPIRYVVHRRFLIYQMV
jgi:hypothetical protein